METRKCFNCKKDQATTEYWNLKSNSDGKDHICKHCRTMWKEIRESTPHGLYELKARLLTLIFRDLWFPNIPEGYHLDHKFSVKKGYERGIPLNVISNKNNLQIISKTDNLRKGERCSIAIAELNNTYEPNEKLEKMAELMKDKNRADIKRWTKHVLEWRKNAI